MASSGERLKQARKFLKLTQRQVGEKLGFQWYKIKDLESGKLNVTPEIATRIEKIFGVNLRWLLTGEGPMFLDEKPEDAFIYIPKLAVALSAGGGSLQVDEKAVQYYAFRREYITRIGPVKSMYLVDIVGDSMEPTLLHGDTALIDTSRKRPHPGVFALRLGDALFVKRLQMKADGKISIISDNPLYPPEEVDLKKEKNCQIIGQVVWFGRTLVPLRTPEEEEEE